jgi:hypothetical protein
MTNTKTAFLVGVLAARTLTKVVFAVANSDTDTGRQIRQGVYKTFSLERLLRIESEVGEEINRRVREQAEVKERE